MHNMIRHFHLKVYAALSLILLAAASLFAGFYITIAPAAPAYACGLPDGTDNGILSADGRTCCPMGAKTDAQCFYQKYLNPLISLLAAATGIVITIAIIYGGIEYITSTGDPQRAASGRNRIIQALIALAAFMLLYGFLGFILPGVLS